MAQDAMEHYELDQVLFVPCASPPHKTPTYLAPERHRLGMLEAVLEDNLSFDPCSIEIDRGGRSYTFDTMSTLREEEVEADLYFIIGADSLLELHTWYRIYELLELCEFITVARPGFGAGWIRPEQIQLEPPWPEKLASQQIHGHLMDISSSDIRNRVAEGLQISYLVPPAVEMYIYEHGLYKD